MAKKKIIGDKLYIPKITEPNTRCIKCNRIICSKKCFYIEGQLDECYCMDCYNIIFSKYNSEQIKKAILIDKNTPVYVGVKGNHIFNGNLSNEIECYGKFFFNNGKQECTVPIKICENCGRITVSDKFYRYNKHDLEEYNLINLNPQKPRAKLYLSDKYDPNYNAKTQRKIPESVIWSANHPYQGGGCSGK